MLNLRQAAKYQRDYAKADKIEDELWGLGGQGPPARLCMTHSLRPCLASKELIPINLLETSTPP